jgi:hypothetical protein
MNATKSIGRLRGDLNSAERIVAGVVAVFMAE